MAGLNALEKRLQSYTSEVEPWKARHEEVMDHYNTADALKEAASFGVYIYDRLQAAKTSTFEESLSLYESLLRWHQESMYVLRAIEKSEGAGFTVDGTEALRSRYDEVNAIVERLKGRIEALNDFVNGRGIPANEFISNLRSYRSA